MAPITSIYGKDFGIKISSLFVNRCAFFEMEFVAISKDPF